MWTRVRESPVVKVISDYFGIRLERMGPELDPSKQYIFTVHPHGNLAFARAAIAFRRQDRWNNVFPGIDTRTLVADVAHKVPFIRELFLWSGTVSASRTVAEYNLTHGMSLIIYPGGEREQIRTHQGVERIVVRGHKHTGFLRLAMKFGTPVVPMYMFGVSDLWYSTSIFYKAQSYIVSRFRVAITLFTGRNGIPLLPRPVRIVAVAGHPIQVPHITDRAEQQKAMPQLLDKYIKGMQHIFDANKDRLGYGDRELLIE
jgi:1-acyl-sn-glycerol-3-phosphate acyltransferase